MTAATNRATFRDILAQAAAQAKALLPEQVNGRIESAVRLVLSGDVVFHDDGTAVVGSASDPMKTYTLAGGACDCQDFAYGRAPQGFCQHRIAANLQRSVERVLTRRAAPEPEPEVAMPSGFEGYPDNDPGPVEEPPPAPAPPAEGVHGIDPRFLVMIQGRPFVRHAGLLTMAHEKGLVELKVAWTYNDAELSLAHAVAVFADGRHFEESGDATKDNVTRKVAPHFRRVALTRASARALRLALGCELVAAEELAEE